MRFQVLVPIALAASADAAMAFAPSSSFTPAARTSARACGAARAGPRLRPAALKMAETEEISQAEYEELLRLAGRGPAEQPAAAAKPAAKQGGGLFGMFGGGGGGGAAAAPKAAAPAAAAPPAAASEWQEVFDEANQAPYWWNVNTGETTWDKPAALAAPAAPPPKPAAAKPAARSGGGLISPGNPVQAKPKPAAKPRVQQAALFDDEDYMSELPPVSASDKPQLQKTVQEQRPAEPTPAPAAARAAPAAAAPSGGGGFFGGLFGGGQKAAAAPAASATPGKEEVSEAELRELMAAAGKNEIAGYSLDVPPGRQAGYKQVKKVVEPNASPASLAPAPVNTGVTELGGVKVTTIRPGDKRNFPQPGDTLTMHYVGKLRDTKQVFDSSIARGQPFQFMIGQGMVIRGWDEGILKMSLGEKAQLVIQSDWGYGATGQGQIPPYADLVFDVDLLAINGVKAGGRFSGGN